MTFPCGIRDVISEFHRFAFEYKLLVKWLRVCCCDTDWRQCCEPAVDAFIFHSRFLPLTGHLFSSRCLLLWGILLSSFSEKQLSVCGSFYTARQPQGYIEILAKKRYRKNLLKSLWVLYKIPILEYLTRVFVPGKIFWFARCSFSPKSGHNRRKLGLSFPNIPLHDKQDSPWWSQWPYYWLLLPFWCHDIMMRKSYWPAKSSKTRTKNCSYSKNMVLGMEMRFNMIAVIILVIPQIIFEYGSL